MPFDYSEDEPISIAAAVLMEAKADAEVPGSKLIFDPEFLPTPRAPKSTRPPARAPGEERSYAAVAGRLQPDQALPTPSAYAPASEPLSSSVPIPASPLPPGHTLPPQPQIQQDAVTKMLKENQDVFQKVIDHRFPRALGKGTASLDGFRNYMIQDWLYLKLCIKLKLTASGSTPHDEEVEGFDFRYKEEYVNKLAERCATMLGIPPSTMKAAERSKELKRTDYLYQTALQNDEAWLGYYVILLPCVLTYYEIAQHLMHDESTARNVVYHRAWTEVNYDDSSVEKYKKFINKNIAHHGGRKDWGSMFALACEREADIFETGLQAPATPFQIIPDGIYSIHISSKSLRLVLAVQNVTNLQPPLDKYLPHNGGSSVVGKKRTGGDHEKWVVSATKTGCTIRNVGTGLYLGRPTASDRGEYHVLQAIADPYCWWINPSSSQPDQGPSLYQIHDSANLRFTLHAATEVVNGSASFTPVIAHENSDAPCQMWSFDDHRLTKYVPPPTSLDKKTEQPPNVQASAAEITQLVDKHSREMKKLRQELADAIAAKDMALNAARELEAERSKMQEQMKVLVEEQRKLKGELEKLQRAKMSMIENGQEQKARINSLRNALLAAVEEAEVSDRKYRDLLRRMRVQVCHWESFDVSGAFRPFAFRPAPIEFGLQNNTPVFVIRYNVDGDKDKSCIYSIQEGGTWSAHGNGKEFRDFQVLVGNPSRLYWSTRHGRFELRSMLLDPVPGLDEDVDEVSDTQFIARYSHSGNVYTTGIKDGADGIPWGSSTIQDYEVLCYRALY